LIRLGLERLNYHERDSPQRVLAGAHAWGEVRRELTQKSNGAKAMI